MNLKLYIVSCDNPKVFSSFMSILTTKIAGIRVKDYDNIKLKAISKGLFHDLNPYNKADVKLVNKVSDIINDYNDGIFNNLIKEIELFDIERVKMFVRVNNLYEMNKLKRIFKRPNYKTVRIDYTTSKLSKKDKTKYKLYKFDSRIQYVDDRQLLNQSRLFITKHIPTIKKIHN